MSFERLRAMVLLAAGCDATDPCLGGESTPMLNPDGSVTGFERCEDGTIHRVAVRTVDPTIPDEACVGDEETMACAADSDCNLSPHGKCVHELDWNYYGYSGEASCECVYACESDEDCGGGEACVPGDLVETRHDYPTCQPAHCETDADCDESACGLTSRHDGCGFDVALACRTPDDACRVDADCERSYMCSGADGYTCANAGCTVGRLLLVAGTPRTAAPVPRDDWAAAAPLAMPDAATREVLALHWVAIAAAEHASVASFARATLQLLALGAPAELVYDTQLAAADEVRHAQIAYGFAATWSGEAVGPGPLALGDALPGLDARSAMHGLVDEACIGEVVGAAEALAAAEGCADPMVRAALLQIAMDESRHAALAWRTLRWLLDAHPELVEEAQVRLRAVDVPVSGGPDLAAYGVLSHARKLAVCAKAAAEVIAPAIEALEARAA